MSKTKGFIAEFKKFIARGNVLDQYKAHPFLSAN